MKSITTVHDIVIDGTVYIMEWNRTSDGPGTITITEGTTCLLVHDDDETCDGCDNLETYNFTEDE